MLFISALLFVFHVCFNWADIFENVHRQIIYNKTGLLMDFNTGLSKWPKQVNLVPPLKH